jgi:hypothetical protein
MGLLWFRNPERRARKAAEKAASEATRLQIQAAERARFEAQSKIPGTYPYHVVNHSHKNLHVPDCRFCHANTVAAINAAIP